MLKDTPTSAKDASRNLGTAYWVLDLHQGFANLWCSSFIIIASSETLLEKHHLRSVENSQHQLSNKNFCKGSLLCLLRAIHMTSVGISYFLISKLYGNCLGLKLPALACLWDLLMVTGQYSSSDGCNFRLSLFVTLPARTKKGLFFSISWSLFSKNCPCNHPLVLLGKKVSPDFIWKAG